MKQHLATAHDRSVSSSDLCKCHARSWLSSVHTLKISVVFLLFFFFVSNCFPFVGFVKTVAQGMSMGMGNNHGNPCFVRNRLFLRISQRTGSKRFGTGILLDYWRGASTNWNDSIYRKPKPENYRKIVGFDFLVLATFSLQPYSFTKISLRFQTLEVDLNSPRVNPHKK